MPVRPIIVWFRNDLRLEDHPALDALKGEPFIPVYIHSREEEGHFPPGAASLVWLHYSLASLKQSMQNLGGDLLLLKGNPKKLLLDLIRKTSARGVFWTQRYEPAWLKRDHELRAVLKDEGHIAESFQGSLLHEPWTLLTREGKPYRVFHPFYQNLKKMEPRAPLKGYPLHFCSLKGLEGEKLEALELLPKIQWYSKFLQRFQPGEEGARKRLSTFLHSGLVGYETARDFPSLEDGVSHLSPHLHFGEISPFQVIDAVKGRNGAEGFIRQLCFREFAHHLLYHFPKTEKEPLQEKFKSFPWREDEKGYKLWTKGLTGYPIVDAGMRELYQTGWMHNRVRMIVGSFLVKDLLISWKRGAEWFWDTLVDADLANNTLGWQWIGGCGADAAPYFRIFNPRTQGEKFDSEGEYIRRYVPELQRLESKYLHNPVDCPPILLKQAGITLGKDYPYPIVDHDTARKRALEAFYSLSP